jgi:hypothetical protein
MTKEIRRFKLMLLIFDLLIWGFYLFMLSKYWPTPEPHLIIVPILENVIGL